MAARGGSGRKRDAIAIGKLFRRPAAAAHWFLVDQKKAVAIAGAQCLWSSPLVEVTGMASAERCAPTAAIGAT
jgi:hypothetical protein